MSHRLPQDHALRHLFRRAVDEAFRENRNLYSPQVAAHLSDELLCDFVHVDRLYRLKDAAGDSLESVAEMLPESDRREGPERRLEVDRYIGDFTLFMVAFFPASVRSAYHQSPQPLVSKVGGILVSFTSPVDYYKAEGRNAYERAAQTARLFDPDTRQTLSLLAEQFEGYQDVLEDVRRLLWDSEEVRALEEEEID